MRIFWRVPLPWLNLTHDKGRLLFRVLGTGFAVLLLFVELGFWDALEEAPVQLIRQFNGKLIIASKSYYALSIKEPFPRRHLDQARAVAGVERAIPIYLEHAAALWKDTSGQKREPSAIDKLLALLFRKDTGPEDKPSASQPIRIIAFDPDLKVLNNDKVNEQRDALKVPFNVLLDSKSKPDIYGELDKYLKQGINPELTGHTVHVAGEFTLGTDFTNDGNVIMSAENFARLFSDGVPSNYLLDNVDIGLIQVAENVDEQKIYDSLQRILPEDVRVYKKDDFIKREQKYWGKTTPMGFIFSLGLFVGFIVGGVICYQIISTDVAEYLPQFATLKAIGYGDFFVCGVVLREAVWLALIGFLPGWGLSALLYWELNRAIGLPMKMEPLSVLLVALFTIVMCMISGIIALYKVWTADPAEVFK